MADPHHIPSGNTAFSTMSAVHYPLPSRSGMPSIEQPPSVMAQQLAHLRNTLCVATQNLPALDAETLSGTLLPESTSITLLAPLVKGLVTVSHDLSVVTQTLTTIAQENEAIREDLHDVSSQLANLPLPMIRTPPKCWLASRHPFVICQIVCQLPFLHPLKRWPPLFQHTLLLSPQAPAHLARGSRRSEHPQYQPPLRLRTLHTSYHCTTLSLARLLGIPRSMLGCTPTATRQVNTGDVHSPWPLSPLATYILTTTTPPPTLKLPLFPARTARTRNESASSPPPNKLRVRSPLLLQCGLPSSGMLNVAFLLLTTLRPLTQMLHKLQKPSPT